MATTYIDARIGATVNFIIRDGETWQATLSLLDANNAPIPLSGFVIGPLEIYDRSGEVIFTIAPNEFTVVNTSFAKFAKNTTEGFVKTLSERKYKCPFQPPGGGPRAIVRGKVKVD
jgi:hypothetical protein